MIIDGDGRKDIADEAAKMVDRLMELGCDSVRIVMTVRGKEEVTWLHSTGGGNLYAQIGSMREWLDGDGRRELAREVSEAIDPHDDDGDDWRRQ